ncbi:hypothetical protein ERJ75_001325200 [Trypanosoma vivax]|nr:hypothetical protein ERJ75_001325200 [Trypanosoma vivax]
MPPRKRGVAKAGNNIARIAGISAPGAHTAASSSSAAAAAAVYTSIGAGGAERSMKRAREQLSEVDDEDITLDILGQRSLVSAVDSTLLLKTPSQSKHHAESSTCIALTDVCTPQRQVAESTSSPAVRETFLHDWSGSSRSKRESFPLGASCSRELAPLNSSTERHYEYILSGSSSRSGSSSSSIDRNNTAVITKENTRLFQVSERGALEDGTITLSPGERSSTVLVRRAAASRPTPSPATLWIYLEDDDEEEEVAASSPQSSPKPARTNNESRSCKAVGDSVPSFVVQMPTAFQRSQSLRREPIADVLPPTFRARKAPLQGGKPSPKAPHALTNGFAIYDDDATSSGEKEREELSAYGSSKSIAAPSTCPSTARPLAPLVNLGGTTCVSSASPATLQCSGDVTYIQDDDCTSASSDAQSSSRAAPQEPADAKEFKKLNSSSEPSKPVPPPSVIAQHASIASDKVNEPCQTPSVRDFIFSSCRRLSGDFGDTTFKSLAEATVLTSAADLTAKSSTKSSSGSGPLPEVARPVDALRSVFPSHFSRKGFLSAAESVVSKPHCLGPGEFWKAFESAEYVGEGSFGLVWRCRTVDGDLVAVKSCPLSLQSRWSIDDAYSVLREIAIMRFLSEHNVPYVLPLCSAFFVQGRETLPPDVVAALKWKVKMEKKLKQEQKGAGKKRKRMPLSLPLLWRRRLSR